MLDKLHVYPNTMATNEMQTKMPKVSGNGKMITNTNLHVSKIMFMEI